MSDPVAAARSRHSSVAHVSPWPCTEPCDADNGFLTLHVKMKRGKEIKKQPKTNQPEGQV